MSNVMPMIATIAPFAQVDRNHPLSRQKRGLVEFRLGDLALGAAQGAIRDWWLATRERPSLVATRPS